jgi:hypothetical protein
MTKLEILNDAVHIDASIVAHAAQRAIDRDATVVAIRREADQLIGAQ